MTLLFKCVLSIFVPRVALYKWFERINEWCLIKKTTQCLGNIDYFSPPLRRKKGLSSLLDSAVFDPSWALVTLSTNHVKIHLYIHCSQNALFFHLAKIHIKHFVQKCTNFIGKLFENTPNLQFLITNTRYNIFFNSFNVK